MRTALSSTLLFVSMLLTHAAVPALLPTPFGVDLNGQPVALTQPDTRAVVLLFVASDCPISNRYLPEVNRLAHAYAERHVRFFLVYPNPGETPAGIRAHLSAFAQTIPALLDPDQSLVKLANAHATPEAAVFLPQPAALHLVYLGRIDNRYISFGRQRPGATRNDLEKALNALLTGEKISSPTTRPVGCAIVPRP